MYTTVIIALFFGIHSTSAGAVAIDGANGPRIDEDRAMSAFLCNFLGGFWCRDTSTPTTQTTPSPTTPGGPPPTEGCGVVPSEERIMGGAPVKPNSIPWQAAVNLKYAPNYNWCGGTIITSKFVISAAHCMYTNTTEDQPRWEYRALSAGELVVLAGEHDLLDDLDAATSHNIESINNHPQYDCVSLDYDYTILELAVAIDLTGSSKARPACLPDAGDIAFAAGTNFVVSGWGKRGDGSSGGKLHHVTTPYVDDATCKKVHWANLTPRMICAGNPRKPTCNGDSGGPLTWVDPNTSRVKLLGVVSFGSSLGCDMLGIPAVFAEVTTVLPWINTIIESP